MFSDLQAYKKPNVKGDLRQAQVHDGFHGLQGRRAACPHIRNHNRARVTVSPCLHISMQWLAGLVIVVSQSITGTRLLAKHRTSTPILLVTEAEEVRMDRCLLEAIKGPHKVHPIWAWIIGLLSQSPSLRYLLAAQALLNQSSP